MSAPSKEEIAEAVATSRASVAKGEVWLTARIIAALADENARLRAEHAECLALLGTAPTGGTAAGSYKAVVEWTEARRELLSKLSRDVTEPCWYCERPSVERRKEKLTDKPGTERDVCELCAEDLRRGDDFDRRERLRDGRD